MRNLLRIELRKALKNKTFLLSFIIGTICAVLSLVYVINMYNKDKYIQNDYSARMGVIYNPDAPIYTLFNHWIGGENGSLGNVIYYFIFPILCAIPYGWSYCVEKKSGYNKTMIVHCGKRKYLTAKYIATFISGGLAMVLPLVMSILMTMCFFPMVKPIPSDDIYYGVFKNSLMSELFYSHPMLYVFIYLCIDFVFCGILTCLCMAAASFIKQKYIVMLVPMLVCLALNFCTRFVYDLSSYYNKCISPFYYLKARQSDYPSSFLVICGTELVMFIISFLLIHIWEEKREVY